MSRRALPDILGQKLEAIRPAGEGWSARCPAHNDGNPSLGVKVEDDGRILLTCHAGCSTDDVMAALGLNWTDFPPLEGEQSREEWTPHGPAVAVYDYRDETGTLLFQVCRTADKQFPQRRPDPAKRSGWNWSLGDVRRVLFRLPQLIAGLSDGRPAWICEGEKDVLALTGIGELATCNPGGAGKWRPEYVEYFRDAYVTVCADADRPGQAHARTVAASLQGVARAVRIVEAATGHKDIAAHLGAGLKLADVLTTTAADQKVEVELAPDIHDLLAMDVPDEDWLIPGLIERSDRLILTGYEGYGKSMLVRQFAVCAAAGLHPFTQHKTPLLKVLFIDCENNLRQTRKKGRGLVEQAARDGSPVPRGALRVLLRPGGIDLTVDDDAAWLVERVVAHRPDLLCIGPLYNLYTGKSEEETTLRKVTRSLDRARLANADLPCALILEAHPPHGEGGKTRTVRPVGSSLLLRWPEFGYGLKPDHDTDETTRSPLRLHPWRGPRDERDFPEKLWRGGAGHWPWVPYGTAKFGIVAS